MLLRLGVGLDGCAFAEDQRRHRYQPHQHLGLSRELKADEAISSSRQVDQHRVAAQNWIRRTASVMMPSFLL